MIWAVSALVLVGCAGGPKGEAASEPAEPAEPDGAVIVSEAVEGDALAADGSAGGDVSESLEPDVADAAGALEVDESGALTSLRGTDRSHWEPLYVEGTRGRVPHRPHYFGRELWGHPFYLHEDRPPALRSDGDIELIAEAAVGRVRDRYDAQDVGEMILSPLKFGLDMFVLPVRVIFEDRPWDIRYTPER